MSRYFHVLSRLEREGRTAGEEEQEATLPSAPLLHPVSPFPNLPLARRQLAHADLLENLRAVAHPSPVPSVVVSGVATESVRPVMQGLAAQAELRGIRLLMGELVIAGGRRVLRRKAGAGSHSAESHGAGEPFQNDDRWSLELVGSPSSESLRGWLREASSGHDLLVVEAPPLHKSVDAALLARACDGLLIVVEPLVTTRRDLRSAVERSRASGCNLLGLVLSGSRHWLPRWLERLLDTPHRAWRAGR